MNNVLQLFYLGVFSLDIFLYESYFLFQNFQNLFQFLNLGNLKPSQLHFLLSALLLSIPITAFPKSPALLPLPTLFLAHLPHLFLLSMLLSANLLKLMQKNFDHHGHRRSQFLAVLIL